MKRKTLSLLLGAILSVVPMIAADDSLEDVLTNYYDAVGGLDAWKATSSCRMSGQMLMPMGMESPFTMVFLKPLKTRLEFSFQEMTGVQVFDGEKAWAILPFMGLTEPQLMPGEQAELMREQADFGGPLIDWEAKGHQVELVRKEEFYEGGAYHLKVTLEGGQIRHFFLDRKSYLPIRLEATTEMQGTEMEVETIFSDYRKVGDLVMAHSIESKPKGAPEGQLLTIESIELNVELGDDLFAFPEEQEEAAEEGVESDGAE